MQRLEPALGLLVLAAPLQSLHRIAHFVDVLNVKEDDVRLLVIGHILIPFAFDIAVRHRIDSRSTVTNHKRLRVRIHRIQHRKQPLVKLVPDRQTIHKKTKQLTKRLCKQFL